MLLIAVEHPEPIPKPRLQFLLHLCDGVAVLHFDIERTAPVAVLQQFDREFKRNEDIIEIVLFFYGKNTGWEYQLLVGKPAGIQTAHPTAARIVKLHGVLIIQLGDRETVLDSPANEGIRHAVFIQF